MGIFSRLLFITQITQLSIERTLWILFAFLVSGRFWIAVSEGDQYAFVAYYIDALFGMLIVLFPLVFAQVFGKMPFQLIRERLEQNDKSILVQGDHNHIVFDRKEKSLPKESQKPLENELLNTEFSFVSYVKNAGDIALKIYNRAGVYLMFGVFIAFGGVLYFAFQDIGTAIKFDSPQVTFALLSRFSILFFIEFIAFFFLKQYRAAMDEFKYYDSVKRNRESQWLIYLMATKAFSETDFSLVVDKLKFFEGLEKLNKNETTEFIELKKFNKNELEVLAGLVLSKLKETKKDGEK